ncbi:MAG: phasin family protein [Thalassobaculaceae bacterium]
MTKQEKQTAATLGASGWRETADKNAASFAAFQGPLVEATSQAFVRYVEGVAELNQEMSRFVAERLRCDAEFGHALADCQSVAKAAEMQQEWIRKAAEDYASEARKLGELGQRLVGDKADPSPDA